MQWLHKETEQASKPAPFCRLYRHNCVLKNQISICCIDYPKEKSRKAVVPQSEIGNLAGLQLKLQFVCDKRDKFGIRRFSLSIADSIAEKSLQSVQIPSVPGHFDGVADGPLHTAGSSLEGFCHLGV